MVRVGLTGNFGMGKSTVLAMFGKLGAYTISADAIVGRLLEGPAVREGVRGIFGDEAFDRAGRLLKDRVADVIFRDGSKRRALEDLLHPMVFGEVEMEMKGSGAGVVVVEVPLLFERGYERKFDRTVTVRSDNDTALRRLTAAGVAAADVALRHRAQLPIEEKARRSDFVVDNSGTEEETLRQVRETYARLLSLSRGDK